MMLHTISKSFRISHRRSGYDKLPIQPATEAHTCCHHSRAHLSKCQIFQIATAFLSLALCTLFALYLRLLFFAPTIQRSELTCGQSVAEAKAMGCKFDLLAKAWLPATCPRHGNDEFVAAGHSFANDSFTWTYWTAQQDGRRVGLDELAAMGDLNGAGVKWWSTGREHSTHCAWILLRMAYAYSNGLRLDHLTRQYAHTKHCVNNLLEKSFQAPDIDEIVTVGNVVFGTC